MGKSVDEVEKIYGKELYRKLLSINELIEENSPKNGKILNDIIDKTDRLVNQVGRQLTTSQLRNIYAKIKVMKDPKEAIMLRPKLAYIAARQRNAYARIIPNFINAQLALLAKEDNNPEKNKQRLESLKTLVEMIVAYHKSHFS